MSGLTRSCVLRCSCAAAASLASRGLNFLMWSLRGVLRLVRALSRRYRLRRVRGSSANFRDLEAIATVCST
ncbi:hypothetical protein BC629DRAFT_1522088 [Irpex lacteus]|nr:hypothetical protein BC629DRAFT_1522088 [Irpex lacteus]